MTTQSLPTWREDGLTPTAVDNYLYNMLPPRDAVLAEMEDQAPNEIFPSLVQQSAASFIS